MQSSVRDGPVWKGHLQYYAALVGAKRAMYLAGWTAGIVSGLQPHIKRVIVQAAANDKDLLRIGVAFAAEGRGVRPGQETRQAGVFTALMIHAERQFFRHTLQARDGLPLAAVFTEQGIPVRYCGLGHV